MDGTELGSSCSCARLERRYSARMTSAKQYACIDGMHGGHKGSLSCTKGIMKNASVRVFAF